MLRKESEGVPEGNDPVPQQEEFGSAQPTLEDVYRKIEQLWWMAKERRVKDRREASLEQDARQPRLAMEVDGPADTRAHERTEGAATTVQAMDGDSCSANRVDPDPMCSTSFGNGCTGPPALPCSREDALVDNGAAPPKSCLPPSEMRTTTPPGSLLSTVETSTATVTIFNQPPFRLYSTEETNLWTSVPSAWCDNSFRRNKLLTTPSCRRVIETKSGQNRMFDTGGSQGRLRACLFLVTWRALLYAQVHVGAA